jgi:YgiT-type zinc finger domain-containing protein
MICEFCGGKTTRKKVRKQHWLRDKLYLVENVEVEVCNECGERYCHAKTLDAIDRLLEGKHEVKASLRVEIVSL